MLKSAFEPCIPSRGTKVPDRPEWLHEINEQGDGFLRMTDTVWIYVNTSKQVGDKDHLKVFASEDAAETWLQETYPEGVAFEYDVLA
jgi:hypothetical protein